MRHFILSGAVSRHPFRMVAATATGQLITQTSLTLLRPSRLTGAAAGTVDLSAIAPAAYERLTLAARTAEETRRCRRRLASGRSATWTHAARNGRMPPHSCPARCRARCRFITCQYWSASRPIINMPRVLLRRHSRHALATIRKAMRAGHGRSLVASSPLPPSGHARRNPTGSHIHRWNLRGRILELGHFVRRRSIHQTDAAFRPHRQGPARRPLIRSK